MRPEELQGAQVALTGPDGREYLFTYEDVVPYANGGYVVLRENTASPDEEGQVLITTLRADNGTLAFQVVEEEEIIEQVYSKFLMQRVQRALAQESDCDCGHNHGHDSCHCHHDHD